MMRDTAHPPLTPDDVRWRAVLDRDAGRDGAFFYGVATTGVYCRPGCPSRRPKRENVTFHATCAAAEAAGFRACRRCTPRGAAPAADQAEKIARSCRMIEAAEAPPPLAGLAAAAGLSPFHFHRVFKAVTGLTPRAYAAAARAARLRAGLAAGATVTEAIYDAGFNSSSRFYETSQEMLGMTATTYRRGGAGAAIVFAVGPCSLGLALAARSEEGVCAVLLGDDAEALERDLRARFPKAAITQGDAAFAGTLAAVIAFIDAPSRGLALPLDLRGTAFQQRVWQALRQVPAGATTSYAGLAAAIGAPKAVRAVAGACAANPVAVAVPCHRVLRTDGGLSGYRWGVARKRALLAKEQG